MTAKDGRRYGMLENAERRSAGTPPCSDSKALAAISGQALQQNRGVPLNLDWVQEVRVNTSAVERRAQTLLARFKSEWSVALADRVEWCSFRRGFPWRSGMTLSAGSPQSAPRQQGRQVFSSLPDGDADHRVGSQNCERSGK